MSTAIDTSVLFSGKPSFFGGLSNERELVALIPDEFPKTLSRENDWMKLASKIFFSGGSIANWKWKSPDKETRLHQLRCFQAALSGFDLKHEHKIALCGWMLSEMLVEVPA